MLDVQDHNHERRAKPVNPAGITAYHTLSRTSAAPTNAPTAPALLSASATAACCARLSCSTLSCSRPKAAWQASKSPTSSVGLGGAARLRHAAGERRQRRRAFSSASGA